MLPPSSSLREIKRLLHEQRLVVNGCVAYVLHPFPYTYCSQHSRVKSCARDAATAVAHVSSHLDKTLTVVNICSVCDTIIDRSIAKHLRSAHNLEPYLVGAAVDLRDVSSPLIRVPTRKHDRRLRHIYDVGSGVGARSLCQQHDDGNPIQEAGVSDLQPRLQELL